MISNFTSIILLCAITVCQVTYAQFIDDASLQLRLLKAISSFDKFGVPMKRRSLAIYAIDPMVPENSPDIWENNVKMFASAVLSHSQKAKHQAFYVFCVVGGSSHELSKYLPHNAPNVAFIKSPHSHGDLQAHISTIAALGDTIVSKFSSVLFLNQDARGPFEGRKDGKWWSRFAATFDNNPSIGIVGSMISCEISPHVQTHAFAMRSEVALEVFSEFNPRRIAGKKNKARHLETSISAETINLGHSISSLYYQRKFNRTVFGGACVTQEGNSAAHRSNPTSWCDVQPQDALFMRFGGHPLRIRGYYCQGVLDAISHATEQIGKTEPALQLVQPETIYGGKFHELYKEFNAEQWRDRNVSLLSSPKAVVPGLQKDKVCLLVRTSSMHGRAAANNTRLALTDLKQLVRTLLRQSNPNWEAYFFVTDDAPFDQELKDILGQYGDVRLKYLPIDMQFRPKYTVRDAGYTATDQALRQVQTLDQCKWLSITNGDNAYGSDVFDLILKTKPLHETQKVPDVVLSPLDSRNYADQDYSRKRMDLKVHDSWELHCGWLEAELSRTRYGYAMTPYPNVGGLDLAGLFMQRKKFVETGVYFSAFTDPAKFVCPGCQDGYFIETMINQHKWTLHRAPILKLSSLIFHGPSPLWCVASGNVWFDHPGGTACLTQRTVGHLHPGDKYDWQSYLQLYGMRVCLRMSQKGFADMKTALIQ